MTVPASVPILPRPRLGVVIPLANEAATVDDLLDGVCRLLQPQDSVFCVLDGVSRDGTRGRVDDRSRSDGRIRCVWAPANRCVVDAYVRGYREALDTGCEWILEMDGGGSHQPTDIPRFLQAMHDGADYAAGCRFMDGGDHTGSLKRRLISRGGTWLANAVLGTRMRDMCSGFECFHREALEYVLAEGIRSRRHFFQTEIRFLLRNWRWVEIPIRYSNPSNSVGQAALTEAFRNLIWLRSRRKDSAHGRQHTTGNSDHHDSGADAESPRAA